MSNFGRLILTSIAALLTAIFTNGTAFDLHETALGDILYSTVLDWAFLILPVLTVALVNRWWALSVALVPLAVLALLHWATDYVYPYHEDPYPALVVMGTVFLVAVSSLGFLLRALFDRVASQGFFTMARANCASWRY